MRLSAGAATTRALSIASRCRSASAVLDQLAIELLAPEPRAAIHRRDLREERRREVCGVVGRARLGRHDPRRVDQPADQRDAPRRGGDGLARTRAEPQPELQHVPGLVGVAPFAELVAPRRLELRPAQRVGVLGREGVGERAVSPFEPAQSGLPLRTLARGRHRAQAGRPVDHHVAHVGKSLADQRDAPDRPRRNADNPADQPRDPFGAGPRLAGAAPAEDEPGRPVVARALGRQLMIVQRTDAPPHELVHVAGPLKQFLRRRLALRNTPQVGA